MQTMKLLAAAAVLSTMVISPVLAQDMARQDMTKQDMAKPRTTHHQKMSMHQHHRGAYDNSYNRYEPAYGPEERRDSGFWPADVAGGIVGGAIGTAGAIAGGAVDTAGAIATAPFGGGPYANNSYYHPGDFVCQPGTYFRGQDGYRHLCQ